MNEYKEKLANQINKVRFLYSYYRVFIFLKLKYLISYNDFQEVMKSILEEHLNLKGVTPHARRSISEVLLEEPKFKGCNTLV